MFKVTLHLILVSIITIFAGNNNRQRQKITKHPVNTIECDSESICFKPIGFFRTPYTSVTGAPRHGRLKPDVKATIELLDQYEGTLDMLEKFEYIIVLYYFDKVKTWSQRFDNLGKHKFGIFATRSPGRPNPIGFAVTKVDSIRGRVLFVSGVDAFDKTPVLDIKPYISSVDVVNSRKNREAEYLFQHPVRRSLKYLENRK